MSEFSDLIPEFIEESIEHLKNVEEDIIIIEQGSPDNELINRVFRAVHSIKGGSSFLGLKNIEHLSHTMEDILNLVRNNELEFTTEISSSILRALDQLKELLEDSEDSDRYDISESLKDLKNCLKRGLESSTGGASAEMDLKTIKNTSIKINPTIFNSTRKKGLKVYLIQFELKDEVLEGKNPLTFIKEIQKTGEILFLNIDMELVLTDDNFTGDGIPLSIVYTTVLEKDLVGHIFGIDEEIIKEVLPDSLIDEDQDKAPKTSPEKTPNKNKIKRKRRVSSQPKDAADEPNMNEKEFEYIETETDVRDFKKTDTPQEKVNNVKITPIEEPEIKEFIEEEEEEEEDSDAIKEINEYLTFWVGDEEYGIGITHVHEIVALYEITPVPNSKNFTKGIINLRGDIIPVYDFRLRLKFEEKTYTSETVILVVMIDNKKIGVIVDRVSEVIQLSREEITEAPQMQDIPSHYLIGIGQKNNKFIILLKLNEIFNIGLAA